MVNIDFLGKGVEIVPPTYFVCDFSRKTFLMLHSINLPIS